MTGTDRSASRNRPGLVAPVAMALAALLAGPAGAPAQDAPAQDEGFALLDALRLTIERQPTILLQRQQVDVSRGNLDLQSGAFDLQLLGSAQRAHTRTPIAPSEQTTSFAELVDDSTSYSLGVQQTLRTGTAFSLTTSFSRLTRNVPVPPNNSTSVTLSVTQPLLRGLGRTATAAGERAASLELRAANHDLDFAIESGILTTAQSYWSFVAASRSYGIIVFSERRFETLVDEAEQLVAGDQIAAADIKQVRANLANRTASRIAAEQTLLQAQQQLGLATGLSFAEFADLPLPSDGFPEVPESVDWGPLEEAVFRRLAAERRSDLEASRARVRSARAIQAAALNGLKPRLDLVVDLSFAGVNEDGLDRFLSAYSDNFSGPSATASLVFEFPMGNRSAEGRLASSRGVAAQNEIATADLERTIAASIKVAVADLRRSVERLRKSREASEIFRSAVEDEKQKLQLGIGTVIDLILTEDNLTQSLLQEVSAEQTFANALVRLRFETGTLIDGEEPDPAALIRALTSVPEVPR